MSFTLSVPLSDLSLTTSLSGTVLHSKLVSLRGSTCSLRAFQVRGKHIHCSGKGPLTTSDLSSKLSPSRVTLASVNIGLSSLCCKNEGVGTVVDRFILGRHSKIRVISTAKQVISGSGILHIPSLGLRAQSSCLRLGTTVS